MGQFFIPRPSMQQEYNGLLVNALNRIFKSNPGADPGFFLGGGALVSCSTSTPIHHIVFFCRIPIVLENRRSSQGRVCTPCTLPLDPPLQSVLECFQMAAYKSGELSCVRNIIPRSRNRV